MDTFLTIITSIQTLSVINFILQLKKKTNDKKYTWLMNFYYSRLQWNKDVIDDISLQRQISVALFINDMI